MMKSRLAFAIVFTLLFPLALLAEGPKYDPSAEVTLQNTAVYVAEHPTHARWTGMFMIMKDGPGEIEVHLAPGSFLNESGIELQSGDSVKVVGSRVRWNGTEIILARELTLKGKTVTLRDKDGSPRW